MLKLGWAFFDSDSKKAHPNLKTIELNNAANLEPSGDSPHDIRSENGVIVPAFSLVIK